MHEILLDEAVGSKMSEGTCWLCLRASMDRILEASRRLFSGDIKVAHGVGVRAAQLLRDAYLKSPAKMSGRKTDSLIGGALYLACVLEGRWMTQREVADDALEQRVTETSIRSSYQLLSELLDIEFPEWFKTRYVGRLYASIKRRG